MNKRQLRSELVVLLVGGASESVLLIETPDRNPEQLRQRGSSCCCWGAVGRAWKRSPYQKEAIKENERNEDSLDA